MNSSEPDLFPELPSLVNRASDFTRFEEFALPDGKIIKLNFGFGKNGEKFYEVGGRRFRAKQRALRALDELQEALADAFAPAQPSQPRSRNRLAGKCVPPLENFQPRIINPKPLIGKDPDWWFAPRFAWLKKVPGMTGAEQDAYAWMAFRASEDGVFRGSVRQLAKDVNCSRRHLQGNVIPSLITRHLIVREDRGAGRPAWFGFVDPEQLGWRTKFTTPDGELSSSELVNSLPIFGELSSPHKEQIEKQQKHEHDHAHALSERPEELTAAEQDLLGQVEELTANENRIEHFRDTWISRIREHPMQVFSAIGETRNANREGRIKKSIGGTLNYHFETFREAARKRRAAGP